MAKHRPERKLDLAAEAQNKVEASNKDKFDEVKDVAMAPTVAAPRFQIPAAPANGRGASEAEAPKPKWQTFDKVTVLLTEEQKNGLDAAARRVMKYRAAATKGNTDKERITANTLLRAIIDNFLEHEQELPQEILLSEKDARAWIAQLFNSGVRNSRS